jgi:hypothetical protein
MLDFDEILISIKDPQIKKYLEESIKSYRVGNYRSAILAIWIAAMFDLVKKFEILVDEREPKAIEHWTRLKPKIDDHKNWEMELVNAANNTAMISSHEADVLESLRKIRNLYAHPSFDDVGNLFDPTPEEVRYYIRTLYDMVLSQPAQLGAFYVNKLLANIKDPNFFKAQISVAELLTVKDLVMDRVNQINKKQVPRLIKSLFKDLNSPSNSEHKINILCFLINIWISERQSQFLNDESLSASWDKYFNINLLLDIDTLKAILLSGECINKLSDKSQELIYDALKKEMSETTGNPNRYILNFFDYVDIVPISKKLLYEIPNLVSMDKIFPRIYLYLELFEGDIDKFSELFGKPIFHETRKKLKTQDGYQVNPILSALRKCNMWEIADSIDLEEQREFAIEIINSLNSNNYETMNLMDFDNRYYIPIKWILNILDAWSNMLENERRAKNCLASYLNHYIGLVDRCNHELNDHSRVVKSLEIIINIARNNPHLLSEVLSLSSSKEKISESWQNILTKHEDTVDLSTLR